MKLNKPLQIIPAILLTTVLALITVNALVADAEAKKKVVVFDFEIADTSGEGELPEHPSRIQLVTELLKEMLRDSGRFEIVSTAPESEQIQSRLPLRNCNGCETDIAKDLGADYAFLGRISKVSTLIMSVSISVTDTERDVPVRAVRVGIRGDTDESWSRGVRYVVKNNLNLNGL